MEDESGPSAGTGQHVGPRPLRIGQRKTRRPETEIHDLHHVSQRLARSVVSGTIITADGQALFPYVGHEIPAGWRERQKEIVTLPVKAPRE